MKKLDKLENEFLPQVMVDTTDIIFDVLKFLEPSSKELIIANTGQVSRINKYSFVRYTDKTKVFTFIPYILQHLGAGTI